MDTADKKVSQAQRRATDKYLEKFNEVRTRMPKGNKAIIQAHAEARGESVNAFVNRAIENQFQRDKDEPATPEA